MPWVAENPMPERCRTQEGYVKSALAVAGFDYVSLYGPFYGVFKIYGLVGNRCYKVKGEDLKYLAEAIAGEAGLQVDLSRLYRDEDSGEWKLHPSPEPKTTRRRSKKFEWPSDPWH